MKFPLEQLHLTKVKVREEEELRQLPQSAILVLGLIHQHCETGNYYSGSLRSISNTLCLSKSSVQKAIPLLMRANLVFRVGNWLEKCGRPKYFVNNKELRKIANI